MSNARVHVGQQIVSAKVRNESIDTCPVVGRDNCAIAWEVGCLRRRRRVILSVQITVLRVGAVTEIGPQTMKTPSVLRQQLALRFETRICVPELRG